MREWTVYEDKLLHSVMYYWSGFRQVPEIFKEVRLYKLLLFILESQPEIHLL